MAGGKTALVSLVKYFWDNHWKQNNELTLVLCGSIAQFMIHHIVHSKALHNRKTFEIHLRALSARECLPFFQEKRSLLEISKFLMIFGGVPKYLEQIDPNQSLSVNMDRLCYQPNSYFLQEFTTLYKEQFKATQTYEDITRALAKGSCSPEMLARTSGKQSGGGLKRYLDVLEQADFIKTQTSVLSARRSKTRRLYLWDHWLRYYFPFIEPYERRIDLMEEGGLFDAIAAQQGMASWFGNAFEHLCIQNLPAILRALEIPVIDVLDYGPYFKHSRTAKQESVQVDLLLKRQNKVLTLVECKYKTEPVGIAVIQEVERKIERMRVGREWSVERVLVSAGPVSRELEKAQYFHHILEMEVLFE